MNAFDKIRREIAAHVPGTKAHTARKKQKLERQLRAAGYSRTHAVAEVAKRFREAKHG